MKKAISPRRAILNASKKITFKSKAEKMVEKDDDKNIYFIDSGNNMLNLALTGRIREGYPMSRIVCVKGAFSSGKSLLCMEACNSVWYNEHIKKGKSVAIRYNDREEAFDKEYGEKLGMPIDEMEWVSDEDDGPTVTVEDFHYDLDKFIKKHKDKDLILYILDSLDSLSDKKEQEEITKSLKNIEKRKNKAKGEATEGALEQESGSYGANKAKYLSKFFRDMTTEIKKTNCLLYIISQKRDDLTKKYGDKSGTSGGKAKDYFYTQLIDLNRGAKLFKTKSSMMAYGNIANAKISKNKVYAEGREVAFNLVFGHGTDNISSIVDFLSNLEGSYKELSPIKKAGAYLAWKDKNYFRQNLLEHFQEDEDEFEELLDLTQEVWCQIEEECSVTLKPKWRV